MKRWEFISKPKSELNQARESRRSLEKVRARLLSPTVEALDGCVSDLQVAVANLQKLESDVTSGQPRPPDWRRSLEFEMAGLRRELHEVNELMAGAGRFYQGWARLLSTAGDEAPANYTDRGIPGTPIPIRSSKVVAIG